MDIKRYLQKESSVLHTDAYTQRESHTITLPHLTQKTPGRGVSRQSPHTVPDVATHMSCLHTCKVSGTSHCYPKKVGIPGDTCKHIANKKPLLTPVRPAPNMKK